MGRASPVGDRLFSAIAKGSVVALILPLAGILRSLALVPLLLRMLGAHGYGLYVLTATGVAYALMAVGLGLDSSLYRFVPAQVDSDRGQEVFSAALTIAAVTCAAAVLAAAVGWFAPPLAPYRTLISAGALICVAQTIWSIALAYERARDRLRLVVAATTVFTLMEAGVYVAGAYHWRAPGPMFLGVLAFDFAWAAAWLIRQVGRIGICLPRRRVVIQVADFGVHSVIAALIAGAFVTADKFIIGHAMGPSTLAFYSPAGGVAQILGALASLSLIAIPHLLGAAQDAGDDDQVATILRQGLKIYLLLGVPALFGLTVVSRPLLILMIGPDLAARATPITAILAVALFVIGLQRFPLQALRVRGQSLWVNLVSALCLAGYLAGVAAAWAVGFNLTLAIPVIYLAATLVAAMLIWRRAQRQIGPVIAPKDVVAPLVVGLLVTAPGLLLDLTQLPLLALFIAGSAVSYFTLLWLFGRIAPAAWSWSGSK